jgi:hypothetical protein
MILIELKAGVIELKSFGFDGCQAVKKIGAALYEPPPP